MARGLVGQEADDSPETITIALPTYRLVLTAEEWRRAVRRGKAQRRRAQHQRRQDQRT